MFLIDGYYSIFTALIPDPIQADLMFTVVTSGLLVMAGIAACWPFLKELDRREDEWVSRKTQK